MKAPELKLPQIKKLNFKWPKFSLPKISKDHFKFSAPAIAKKSRTLLVEISEEWLKMAAAVQEGRKIKILGVSAEAVKGQSDLDISQKISAFVNARVFKPTTVLIVHPANNLTMRILMLPSTDPKEIKDIVELQAVKQTPYAKEEITSAFSVIDREASGYSRVLLAITHRDVASRYFRVVELAKMMAERITLSLQGTQAWFQKIRKPAAGQVDLLLDVDGSATDLLILKGDKLLFSRSLGIGAKQIKEQGTPMEGEFLREVQRSLESGAAELKDDKVTNVVLAGTAEPLKNLSALLSRELNLPCEVQAVAGASEDWIDAKEAEVARSAPVSFASILGFGLNPQAATINLIPPEIQVRKGLEERARDLALLGTLLLALMTLISAVSFEKLYKRGTYLHSLEKDYASIHRQAEEVERLVAKMRLAQDQLAAGKNFLDILKDINEVIPENIYLSSLQFNEKERSVTIRGIAEDISAVFHFVSTIESTPHLESANARSTAKKKIGDKDAAEFEIVAAIGKSGLARTPQAQPAKEEVKKAETEGGTGTHEKSSGK